MLAPKTHLKERYRILQKIGGGGFGHVYKAIDEVFGCCVAVKETKEEVAGHDKLRKAFEREAKLLRHLKHDCLPRVTDYFSQDHAQFLVMDFIEGEDFAALLKQRLGREGPFHVSEILPWADRILSALEYLHSRPEPIIHRDIKPSNIKLADDGGIYLLDFGLAKGVAGQMSTVREGESSFSLAALTHEYAPLEQFQETGTRPQSDIYSLGATLYHLLTGRPPISSSRRDEAIQREQSDPLRSAHEVNESIPPAVSDIISRAMAVRWWHRVESAKEMRASLAESARDMVQAQLRPGVRNPLASESALPSADFSHKSTLQMSPLREEGVERVSKASSANIPPQVVQIPPRFRRRWIIATLSLVGVIAAAATSVSVFFPHWFAPVVSTKPTESTSPSTTPNTLKLTTPSNLKAIQLHPAHNDTIWSVAFSPDGNLAASGSEDKTILLWNTTTWTSQALLGHEGPVYSVAFSPDSKTLASASRDKTIKLWDTSTRIPRTLPIDETKWQILRVAFSPDGNYLASCGGKDYKNGCEEIRIWKIRDDWKPRTLRGSLSRVHAIAFSPDSRTLVSVGLDRQMHFWDTRSGEEEDQKTLDQDVTSVSFFRENGYLACGLGNGTIKLWRYESGNQNSERSLQLVGSKPQQSLNVVIAASPDNRTLASAIPDQTIKLWDITSGISTSLPSTETRSTQMSLAFSPDGQKLITGGSDRLVRVWQ